MKLEGVKIEQLDVDFEEDHSLHVSEIPEQKVLEAYKLCHKSVIFLDIGFYIPSLNNYHGSQVKDLIKKGNQWLLEQLKGKDRTCYWQHAVAYMHSNMNEPVVFCDKEPGRISFEELGEEREWVWSDLAKVFIPKRQNKTLSQMNKE